MTFEEKIKENNSVVSKRLLDNTVPRQDLDLVKIKVEGRVKVYVPRRRL